MTPELDTALGQLAAVLTDFNTFLEEEAAALMGQDAERLAALLPRRNELHRSLAGGWLALARLAGTAEPKGLADLRARLFPQGPLPPRWTQLEALVHASDRLNQVNGRLMEKQMQRTQVALQILQNSVASRGVYGSDGRMAGLHNTLRTIDSA
jgi:flagellar biosynthesis/type III secretory pathway chaperone